MMIFINAVYKAQSDGTKAKIPDEVSDVVCDKCGAMMVIRNGKFGRINIPEREASERKKDFEPFELGMSCEESCQEAGRCLRCDHFGYASFRGGRTEKW